MYEYIQLEKNSNAVAKIKLNRPEAMNALNSTMVAELIEVANQLEKDPDIASIIVVGAPKFFISGADITEMKNASVSEAHFLSSKMKALHDVIIQSKKPYIAAISGYCLGGGFELALACDIRIANDTATFGLPEINLGIIPGAGGIHRLTEITGISYATQLVMTGERIDAQTAFDWKIVNSVSSNVEDKAISIASSIAAKSRYAIQTLKKLLQQRRLKNITSELEEEINEFALLFDKPDAFEGMSAFVEKRQPIFQKGTV